MLFAYGKKFSSMIKGLNLYEIVAKTIMSWIGIYNNKKILRDNLSEKRNLLTIFSRIYSKENSWLKNNVLGTNAFVFFMNKT